MQNPPGVLSQVSRLFSRKGYNIESLAVGTTDDPAVSRITIEVTSDEAMIEQIMNQLRKLFPVYSVQELLPERSIRRELVMFKVKAETHDIRNEVIQIANIFRASIIDVSLKSLTLALIGGLRHPGAGPYRHGGPGARRLHHQRREQGKNGVYPGQERALRSADENSPDCITVIILFPRPVL